MTDPLRSLDNPCLVEALEANVGRFLDLMRLIRGSQVEVNTHLGYSVTNVAVPIFNCALSARLSPESARIAVKKFVADLTLRQVPGCWVVGPSCRPQSLPDVLREEGFQPAGEAPAMAMMLKHVQSPARHDDSLSLMRVDSEELLREWCETLVAGYGLPHEAGEGFFEAFLEIGFSSDAWMQNFLCRWNGRPIATSSLRFAAGVAGIYNVSVLPNERRRGIGTLMSLSALEFGREKGYAVGVLLASSPASREVYHAIGFQECGLMRQFVWEGDS